MNHDGLKPDEPPFRSGFVCLAGLPNAGKSTLLNQIAGQRLAITTPKPQTTRGVIRAIVSDAHSQIILTDTPGLLRPRSRLDQVMEQRLLAAATDADIVVLLRDASCHIPGEDGPATRLEARLLNRTRQAGKPVVLLLNKVDSLEKPRLLPQIAAWSAWGEFAAIIPISARTGDGVPELLRELRRLLPEGPRLFPEDSLTDQTERELAAEIIREQILHLVHEEIPHGTAVEIEAFKESGPPGDDDTAGPERQIHIAAAIYCEKDSHKGILIGRGGAMLKQIGIRARQGIEEMTGAHCYLELFVKVRQDWQNRHDLLDTLGYRS